jgi:cytoskeletal protein RodZ
MSQAADMRGARRRRILRIRRTVVAISLAMFIALFSGLYVQMAAGRDPVLGSQTVATGSGSSSGSGDDSSTSSDESSTSSDDSATSSNSTATSTDNTAAATTAVTTSQS